MHIGQITVDFWTSERNADLHHAIEGVVDFLKHRLYGTGSDCCRIVLSLCLGFLMMAELRAQSLPDDGPVRFSHLGIEDGLSQRFVFAVLQDQHGFMWFGTTDGLNKFDGSRFTLFQHDPNDANSLRITPIEALLEDRNGMIWIGYNGGGLSRFDPYTETFTHYRHDPSNPASLSHDAVRTLYEDRRGRLWIGTVIGLDRFDPETQTFTRFVPDPERRMWVSSILEDSAGILWVGLESGLYRYDPSADTLNTPGSDPVPMFTRFPLAPEEQTERGANWVTALHEDQAGTLWVGAWGLHRFNRDTATFDRFLMDPDAAEARFRGANRVSSILDDHTGTLWVGSTAEWGSNEGGGLNRFDRAAATFTRYLYDPDDPGSLSSNNVQSIYEDRQGILWIGTVGGGINYVDRTARLLTTFPLDASQPNGLHGKNPSGIFLDRDDVLWIGTRDGMLNRFDRRTGINTLYRHNPANPFTLPSGAVRTIHRDRRGRLWIGTERGLYRLDEATGRFTRYAFNPKDTTSPNIYSVMTFHEDRAGVLWVGDNGLYRIDPENETLTRYVHDSDDPTSLSEGPVIALYEDRTGTLWAGTGFTTDARLNRFNAADGTFTRYPQDASDSTSMGAGVFGIYERPKEPGILWITAGYVGLYRFDVEAGRVTRHYTSQNSGLPSNAVYCVLGDDRGLLWMSTHNGLAHFNPENERFKVFGPENGVQSLEFQENAFHKGYNAELFFGGKGGVNAVLPEAVFSNPNPPQVALTGLRIFNEPVVPGPDAPLKVSITEAESVVLSHAENDLTLEYIGLHFRNPERNRYAYILEGYDDDWRDVGAEHRAVYTGLPPDNYVFRVKAANSDGVWNEQGRSLFITIRPPWWQTTWAYLVYGLLLIGCITAVNRAQRRRLIRRERERSMKRELEQSRQIEAMNKQLEVQNRRLLELDEFKSRFFANISHEFRTPLTLILGPLKDLLDGAFGGLPDTHRSQLTLMQRNGRHLLRLINQLLDLARLEAGHLTLRARRADIIPLVKATTQAFASMARRKQISLQVIAPQHEILLYFEPDKLEKILYNLLSNAFKFTPDQGTIEVWVKEETGNHVEILVRDTGQGIPVDALPFIFDRFHQADASSTREQEGTGIGLALTRELVALHGGTIHVESTEGVGSTFTVCLPTGRAHLGNEDIMETPERDEVLDISDDQNILDAIDHIKFSEESSYAADGQRMGKPDAPVILVVEDNDDVRSYLRSHLTADYRIVEAVDGIEGLEQARMLDPALILSDVMMPRLDGYELCRAIKTDEKLNHIPVVLLTAKADDTSKIEGLETGADDYLYKPFNAEELLVRVENLIEIRRQLRTRFSQKVMIQPSAIEITPNDAAFLEKVQVVVEDQMGNSSFSGELLADTVGLSRRQLDRRLKALANLTASGFIRKIRLERAVQLLEQDYGNVAEVARVVGFGSSRTFSELFRQTLGIYPSDYLRKKT